MDGDIERTVSFAHRGECRRRGNVCGEDGIRFPRKWSRGFRRGGEGDDLPARAGKKIGCGLPKETAAG
jgi:hypothetical protein